MAAERNEKIIVLFDVDGTLTPARKVASPEVLAFLAGLRKKVVTGMVGGSDLPKQREQLGEGVLDMFDYVFAENGLNAFKDGKPLAQASLVSHLGDATIKRVVNRIMLYMATEMEDIPVKRGTFIEFRNGMLNVSPVGRNCSQEERDAFEAFDREHHVRSKMVEVLSKDFADLDLKFSIGGQISFDLFPQGWDKTYCLRFLESSGFDEIHFFGDKTWEGGNDHEIFADARTIGHTVTGPEDTLAQLRELFGEVESA
mmetsp:Transcript_5636/g.20187  ORF Transcript_5636/g.20187 Transcript_5636/m.20187 type:complete len:256 (-) Transcript_5636:49-816(-)|eukprot:CAMPEP_0203814668 /NCGR_PEP_ID=MMETSP0115-20131106/5418_1 /ASSEMBLY_ACC=CAM_ASM_000227 /TAXON_ID=33651 /ORGANISM="Bicosoecid sp, Strain ms1" /LENGTH=255 /DNA_ID=CAMNT_0050723549 /DNA_START=46 /DNA_END=813 /DNA_ORIENTATION=+